MKKLYFLLLSFTSFIYSSSLYGADSMSAGDLKSVIIPDSASNVLSPDTRTAQWVSFLDRILDFARDSIFSLLMLVAIGVFIFIGARLVIARWNPEEFKKALQSFVYAVVGIFVVAAAWVMVRFVAWLDI